MASRRCRLSSAKFFDKFGAVVKKTTKEKVRKKSESVAIFYVNQSEYSHFKGPVEKPCGKVCGECGKVRVFNSYFDGLENNRQRKKLHIPVHKPQPRLVAMALCCRVPPKFSRETLAKKLAIFLKAGDQAGGERGFLRKNL